jgi:hypothetical protein
MKIDELLESVEDSSMINRLANAVAKWMYQNEPAEYPLQSISKMTGIKDTPLR